MQLLCCRQRRLTRYADVLPSALIVAVRHARGMFAPIHILVTPTLVLTVIACAAVAAGGGVDNWVGRDPACTTQRAACSIRFGGLFSYTIRTVAGRSYRLHLTFSEVWWTQVGQRSLDVLVDGAVVLTGVDPFALAGAKFTAVVRELDRTATGANMVVSLQARVDNAALASLEVGVFESLTTTTFTQHSLFGLPARLPACLPACLH